MAYAFRENKMPLDYSGTKTAPIKPPKRHWLANAAVICAPFVLAIIAVADIDWPRTRMLIPMAPSYFVQSLGYNEPKNFGSYQLIHITEPMANLSEGPLDPSYGTSPAEYLSNVEKIATEGKYIFGKTSSDFFLLDATASKLRLFETLQELTAALNMAGINNILLHEPLDFAKHVPGQKLRPWAYQNMKGYLSLSDPTWSALVEDLGLLIAIAIGLVLPHLGRLYTNWTLRLGLLVLIALPLGTAANYLANGTILDGGPDAFVGQFILPAEYTLAAIFSWYAAGWIDSFLLKGLRRLIARRSAESL